EEDMDRLYSSETLPGADVQRLRDIVERLHNTYCRSIGVQFMHIDDLGMRQWLEVRMERSQNRTQLTREEQLSILTRLTDAVVFEEFLQKKFVGAKSFSLEGGESLIPLLALAIEKAGEQAIDEIVLAMAHRGRLNVLANIMGKSPRDIFTEFEDADPLLHIGRGDVKYHLGFSSDWTARNGHKVHLSLCFNPSHLEFVNPVALGRVRAKQDRVGDVDHLRGMALLIHGDAAFAGQGVVQEILNYSQLPGYATGGTLHVIVNNQIGFTTPPEEGRSTRYATDVAKMLQVPIFHVNGEDPEAVAQCVRLAMEFRANFQRDVFIDMYCYRRRGHNEGDEPAFTQPMLYQVIERRPSVREGYLEHLLRLGAVSREEAERILEQRRERLERDLTEVRSRAYVPRMPEPGGVWKGYRGGDENPADERDTAVPAERLAALLEAQARLPADFHPHPKIQRLLHARREMAAGQKPLDWAAAEALAFASLVTQGVRVRLSGQDSQRGTFSQRHAALHDVQTGRVYVPLEHLAEDQAAIQIINSPLSEVGVLGFEYGYSLDAPDALVMWEAQFGDFANAAQVIIDQFICSAEDKWRRLSGLVLLLPHGFEGQGPEHSSARLERFLTLATEYNIQVVYPTTPAQYFHCLRRQVLRPWRKPLVVMTPKSLLRHPQAVSSLAELAGGRFERILPDRQARPEQVRRILLCSGKVYYDLQQEREKRDRQDVAIVRVEQLYPLSEKTLAAVLEPYADGTPAVWVQEEPQNMGAWSYMRLRFGEALAGRLPFSGVYRPPASSPATGSASSHKLEQRYVIEKAFGDAAEARPRIDVEALESAAGAL
ncbi:MAG: 2-oxoglutarate dehydrogenase E1 component, partial [Phycisphaerae bacterium]